MERAFEVLQGRFAIVHGPATYFDQEVLKDIMYACIILHNIIIEDELHLYLGADQFVYEQWMILCMNQIQEIIYLH